jgi:geranylgeranyl diphosphate synthase, type I
VNPRRSGDVRSAPPLAYRTRVEEELERFLRFQQERMASRAAEALAILDELATVLRAGGKRLRPLFAYWGHRAGGGADSPAVARAGAAMELLHTCAVIHDDLMDRSSLRRGEPTTFRRLAGSGRGGERLGRSAAILAGDLALTLADQLLASSAFPPDRVVLAFEHFNVMRTEAVSGQYLDLLSSQRHPGDEPGARRVARLKSGSYTVEGPLLVGAALAGASPAVEGVLRRYGGPLGEAFQLRDDVLGTFGDPSVTGKDGDTDVLQGKRTVLVAKAWQLGSAEVRRLIAERLGREDLTPAEVEEVRSAIRSSGALAETIALIDSLAAEAKASLRHPAIDADVAGALGDLADVVALRDA